MSQSTDQQRQKADGGQTLSDEEKAACAYAYDGTLDRSSPAWVYTPEAQAFLAGVNWQKERSTTPTR